MPDEEHIVGDGHVHHVVQHLAVPELIAVGGEERLTEWPVTRQVYIQHVMSPSRDTEPLHRAGLVHVRVLAEHEGGGQVEGSHSQFHS